MKQNDAMAEASERVFLSTRVEPELADAVAKSAKRNRRSVSSEIALALQAWVNGYPQEVGTP